MNNTTRSELSFSPTVEDDGKFMVCRAENPVVSGLFLESTWKLSVVCEYFRFIPPRLCAIYKSYLTFHPLYNLCSSSRVHDAFISSYLATTLKADCFRCSFSDVSKTRRKLVGAPADALRALSFQSLPLNSIFVPPLSNNDPDSNCYKKPQSLMAGV